MENEQKPEIDEPLEEDTNTQFLGTRLTSYTRTGWLWLVAPWLLIFRKKLRCSLIELLIFVLALESSCAAILGTMLRVKQFSWFEVAIAAALISQAHLWGFARALYNQRVFPDRFSANGLHMAAELFLPTLFCNFLGRCWY